MLCDGCVYAGTGLSGSCLSCYDATVGCCWRAIKTATGGWTATLHASIKAKLVLWGGGGGMWLRGDRQALAHMLKAARGAGGPVCGSIWKVYRWPSPKAHSR